MTFRVLGLAEPLLRAVDGEGYTTPTPIQLQAIPHILAARDLLGCAQTGTGKTAAFVLPALMRLSVPSRSTGRSRGPRVLVLTPTRELAQQVSDATNKYGRNMRLKVVSILGGMPYPLQNKLLSGFVDILVATPGRLLDHVENKSVSFNSVQALVLDEADRMLDMGFVPDVTRILNMLPEQRQSLLFSATFSEEIKRLADRMLKSPVLIEVARRNQVSENIMHRVHPVSEFGKRGLLIKLLKSGEIRQCLVFMRTKQGCSRLTRELQRAGIHADAIHGDKSQLERLKALDAFKAGQTHALIATGAERIGAGTGQDDDADRAVVTDVVECADHLGDRARPERVAHLGAVDRDLRHAVAGQLVLDVRPVPHGLPVGARTDRRDRRVRVGRAGARDCRHLHDLAGDRQRLE